MDRVDGVRRSFQFPAGEAAQVCWSDMPVPACAGLLRCVILPARAACRVGVQGQPSRVFDVPFRVDQDQRTAWAEFAEVGGAGNFTGDTEYAGFLDEICGARVVFPADDVDHVPDALAFDKGDALGGEAKLFRVDGHGVVQEEMLDGGAVRGEAALGVDVPSLSARAAFAGATEGGRDRQVK